MHNEKFIHLYLALLCAVYVVNGVDLSRKNERRMKSNVMIIKAESAPSKTIQRAIWPVPDSLAGIEDGFNPTPSPTGAIGQNPTPSPTGSIQLSPTPSPDPTPTASITTELVPTASPTGDPGLQPTPSPLNNIGLNPTHSPTRIGLTLTPSPLTTIVSNGAPTSSPTTESRSAKVTLPSVTFSTTVQNGAEKAESLNLCLAFYCCLMVLMNL